MKGAVDVVAVVAGEPGAQVAGGGRSRSASKTMGSAAREARPKRSDADSDGATAVSSWSSIFRDSTLSAFPYSWNNAANML